MWEYQYHDSSFWHAASQTMCGRFDQQHDPLMMTSMNVTRKYVLKNQWLDDVDMPVLAYEHYKRTAASFKARKIKHVDVEVQLIVHGPSLIAVVTGAPLPHDGVRFPVDGMSSLKKLKDTIRDVLANTCPTCSMNTVVQIIGHAGKKNNTMVKSLMEPKPVMKAVRVKKATLKKPSSK